MSEQITLAVELRPAADLQPYSRNARKHSPDAIRRLATIIEDMGWTSPILADEDGIVAGHKRQKAALLLYSEGRTIRLPGGRELPAGMVPVIDCTGWTEAQRRAYILADNQTTLESEWDGDLLRLELSWLEGSGIDLALTGFDGDALAAALSAGEEAEPEEPAPLKVKLADRFGVPPFSVLNAREGWWQDRKEAWLALGIMSELGRGENLLKFSDTINEPDPKKRAAKKAASESEDLRGGLTHRTTTDPYRAKAKGKAAGATNA